MSAWNAKQLAEALGLTTQRIGQLVKEEVIPKPTKQGHDPMTAIPAYLRFLKQSLTGKDLDAARIAKYEIETELRRLELRRREGELIAVTACANIWERVAVAIRSKLLALPTKFAPLVTGREPRECAAILQRGVHEALTELSQLKIDNLPEGDT